MDELGAAPLDPSAPWAVALQGGGPARVGALFSLRAHLTDAAQFELGRRGMKADGARTGEAASLVRDAAEAALRAILADLDRYRGQSRFTTWTAKYAIREAAAAARENATAGKN